MQKLVNVYQLGRIEYNKCLRIQKYLLKQQLLDLNSENSSSQITNNLDSILLVEHDPVYTIGLRKNAYSQNDLDKLRKLNAQVEITDRGGLITFHGTGQLVAYPILNLKRFNPSLKWYVSRLEQTIIDLCKNGYNLKAERMCKLGYTGVWVNDAKIAALGVHCKRYITYHGVSLNCNVDLKWFDYIVPCGIDDKKVTSLSQQLKREVNVNSVVPFFLEAFENLFNSKLIVKDKVDVEKLILSTEKVN